MRADGWRRSESWTSFGQRRGISDPTRFSLDLTRTKADSGGAAGPGSYPSPPMSGSPPLPPKISHEVADRIQGSYQATTQDVYRGSPLAHGDERTQTGVAGGPRSLLSETPERPSYGLPRLEGPAPPRPAPYHPPPPPGQTAAQPAAYLPAPGTAAAASPTVPLPAPQAYPAPSPHPTPVPPHHQPPPPKPQRKTKGHVASACVPCKKAHLRFVCPRLHSQISSVSSEG